MFYITEKCFKMFFYEKMYGAAGGRGGATHRLSHWHGAADSGPGLRVSGLVPSLRVRLGLAVASGVTVTAQARVRDCPQTPIIGFPSSPRAGGGSGPVPVAESNSVARRPAAGAQDSSLRQLATTSESGQPPPGTGPSRCHGLAEPGPAARRGSLPSSESSLKILGGPAGLSLGTGPVA